MFKCLISVIILEFFLNLTPAYSACIFLNNCAVAQRYIKERRNNPDTINILQKAHCGFEARNGQNESKVTCDQIPPFPELPSDCIRFSDCLAAVKLIDENRYDPKVIKLLQSSTCGESERKDLILCNKITQVAANGQKLPSVNECGHQRLIPKITGGQIAELDDFNWIVLLRFKNATGHLNYGCHGTLISDKYVVTAAHCFINKKKTLHSVVLGEYDIRTPKDCVFEDCAKPIQELSVESVLVHPNFQSQGAMNDIALIRLNGTAKFTDFVSPICLPLNIPPLQQNEPLWIAGWGKIENRTMSNIKLKAQIFFLTKNDCIERKIYRPDDTMLCAGSDNGADTCKGDSGGPLMVLRAVNDEYKFFLGGVVSFGGECGSRAAIYTDVRKFTDWIENNMKA